MVRPIQVHPASGAVPTPGTRAAPPVSGNAFASVLHSELQRSSELRFSAHALQRLEERGIELGAAELAEIVEAVDQVAAKGGRESLLLLDRMALVVSVPNRTVITVVSNDDGENTVFTQIDSAVVVSQDGAPQATQEDHRLDPLWGGLGAVER